MFNGSFLSKQHIRRAVEFDLILQKGKRLSFSCFALCFKQSDHATPRLGMMIAKRHCRLAVKRNRIKRQIREYFRLHQSALPNVDIVFLLRSSTDKITDEEQMICIESLFEKLIAQSNGSVST